MSRMRGWIVFAFCTLAVAGCMTTREAQQTAPVASNGDSQAVPEALKACGHANFFNNQIFEICGIGPEGAATAKAQNRIYTQTCGWIEATEPLKHYFCQKADGMFAAMNPYRTSDFIAANYENKTRALYDRGPGNQIDFFAKDGKAYFWVANQPRVLVGEWIVFRNAQVCFHVTGVTEHNNTRWDCHPMVGANSDAEVADGDVAGLARHGGAVPWVLQAQPQISLGQIEERVKSLPNGIDPHQELAPPARGPAAPVPSDPMGPMVMNEPMQLR
jgi:hypothetical protein